MGAASMARMNVRPLDMASLETVTGGGFVGKVLRPLTAGKAAYNAYKETRAAHPEREAIPAAVGVGLLTGADALAWGIPGRLIENASGSLGGGSGGV
jgi:hypothetical protein